MIVSSTVGRCWMAYLLLVTHVVLTSSSPIPKRRAKDRNHLCGSEFSDRLEKVCAIHKGTWLNPSSLSTEGSDFRPQDDIKKTESRRSRTRNECCLIGCTQEDLESYCEVIRNQTTVQPQNSQELSAALMTESIAESSELLPTTETPSDSTPEYILNESLEQEALTILSTYRTPQYSINSLQFL
ncbi:insulin/IGF/relaxin-like peptide 1 [Daphnia sinensis]|uniref:Insulin/IGF/relaxin-like peptide 1 n=1 Tax=Daphnia sinensis TaxID=1820382 RepID=A0AAD5Q3J3_9CRUS|nr:insulin/IGF/relaxin-like peptide 1 [Daphnia sinensis]